MKTIPEASWRQPMGTAVMRRLPLTITINMKTQSYAVRDISLQFIHTDDIDEAGVDEMVQDMIMEFRFERFDINALLPERIYRAESYGMQ